MHSADNIRSACSGTPGIPARKCPETRLHIGWQGIEADPSQTDQLVALHVLVGQCLDIRDQWQKLFPVHTDVVVDGSAAGCIIESPQGNHRTKRNSTLSAMPDF
jgi:hypothetical protein